MKPQNLKRLTSEAIVRSQQRCRLVHQAREVWDELDQRDPNELDDETLQQVVNNAKVEV